MNSRDEYTNMHAYFLELKLEMAENWKNFNSIYSSLYYHSKQSAPVVAKTIVDILKPGKDALTSSGNPFFGKFY